MAKVPSIESLLKNGSAEWNRLRKAGTVSTDHTGATFAQLFSANADLSGLALVGTEWEKCDLSKVSFRDTDLSNAYFHGGRLQDCDFRGANLDGATFEKLKLLRCDFSGAQGLEALELDDVDMDRVQGLNGEEAPPPPPPPAHGVTSFTREQRTQSTGGLFSTAGSEAIELLPFRPQDAGGTLLFRGLKKFGPLPAWVLDVPGQRPPVPQRLPPGTGLESMLREAVKQRLEGARPVTDPEGVKKAQRAIRQGGREAAPAAMYLREVGAEPEFRFSAEKALKEALRQDLEEEDLTASVDPRVTGALLELRLPFETGDALVEVRRRLAATRLFTSLMEAGFFPDNNWEEALEASEPALELQALSVGEDRASLGEAFRAFAGLPEESRLRRLGYLAEAESHLEELSRLPEGTQPSWLSGPESREHDEREMQLVQVLKAQDIPLKVPELAVTELGVPAGSVPEDSDGDLFVHVRCSVCGLEKLLVQSPAE